GGAGGHGAAVDSIGALGTLAAGTTGGAGGAGGASTGGEGGSGGNGGTGLIFTGIGEKSFTINADITGGVGGAAGAGVASGALGLGGAGIVGSDLSITMGAAGAVIGGVGANAITFTGGLNSITFLDVTSGINGNMDITGLLTLRQTGTFVAYDHAITGSGAIAKTGTGEVRLTAPSTYLGSTTVTEGTLSVFALGGLGSATGAVIVNGGTLGLFADQTKGNLSGTGGNIALSGGGLTATQTIDQTYAGTFSGGSTFTKAGTAILSLTGDSNSFTGDTTVAAGTLAINNSAGTYGTGGTATVQSGATLAGTGTIGGDVAIANAGTLAAGNAGAGTLTIDGDLLLNASSIASFELGAAGVVGGALNDLVNVGGLLTLDGTLNIDPATTGHYRLFNYGTLLDNGATVVSTLGTGTLQLATANQVNVFVNNAGQLMQFWDGINTVPDGLANGGTGTWTAGTTNWTSPPDFTFNDTWQSQVGVFGSTGGIVTVVGTQDFEGLQFTVNGYQLTGGTLNMLGDAPGATPAQSFLNVDTGIATAIASTISGSAADIGLRKLGGGTLTLSGANTYTGDTTFGGGIVSVAADNNLGVAGGLVFAGGTLQITGTAFNATARSIALETGGGGFDIAAAGNSFLVSPSITGLGGLTKLGLGTLVLANDNSYSGGTVITGGTLRIGNGGTTGSLGSGDTVNNARLEFDRTNTLTYAGVISGTGAVAQIGSGQTTLTGISTYTGATTVTAGQLRVNGSIAASSSLTVATGATVGGTGILPTTTLAGTLSPGNAIGTITVDGDITFAAGSTYAVEVAPGAADRTSVTGAAILSGGTVAAAYDPGSFVARQYVILDAAGGTGGTSFAGLTGAAPAGFSHALAYDATNVYLQLSLLMGAGVGPFADLNRNQQAVADALVGYFDSTGGIPAAFAALDRNGLTAVSAETGTAVQQAGILAADRFLDAISAPYLGGTGAARRTASAFDVEPASAAVGQWGALSDKSGVAAGEAAPGLERFSVWGAVIGATEKIGGDAVIGAQKVDSDVYGLASGFDYIDGGTRAGIALGASWANASLAGLGSADVDNLSVGLRASHDFGNLYIAGAAAYSHHAATTTRNVGGETYTASFTAHSFAGRAETGYRFRTEPVDIIPYAAIRAISLSTPGYVETGNGAGTFALAYASDDTLDLRSELGLRLRKHTRGTDGNTTLSGAIAWAHDFDPERRATAGFVTLPGTSFVTDGATRDSDTALVSMGFRHQWDRGVAVSVDVDGGFGADTTSLGGKVAIQLFW
ncbi:MAG: autotransporter domain-containing protein, partial [Parvibaculum sp.]|nr:autotransporter domain-containing protein [Parvibaculum sp.]